MSLVSRIMDGISRILNQGKDMSLTKRSIKGRGGGFRRILATGDFPSCVDEVEKLKLLRQLREGNAEAKDKLILVHIRLAVSIVDRYIAEFNCRHLDDELDDAAIEAVVVAVNRVEQGHMKHDNITGYIVLWVHSLVSKCLRNSSLVPAPRGHRYRKSIPIDDSRTTNGSEDMSLVLDIINRIISTPEEQRIVDLKIASHTDKEVAKIMEIPQVRVQRIRQILRKRFERLNQDV